MQQPTLPHCKVCTCHLKPASCCHPQVKKMKGGPASHKSGATRARECVLTQRHAYTCIAGVDEAGRGPLAGPVVAAACILPCMEEDEVNAEVRACARKACCMWLARALALHVACTCLGELHTKLLYVRRLPAKARACPWPPAIATCAPQLPFSAAV